MVTWIFAVVILTPWFWSLSLPQDFWDTKITEDIRNSRMVVNWERGKTDGVPLNFLFVNWPTEFLSKRVQVLMENLDIGNYFFAGHPRERIGVRERQKFFFFQFILLIVGLGSPDLKKYRRFLIFYTVGVFAAVLIFAWRSFEQTFPLAVPFILVMALGLKQVFSFPKKWLIIFSFFAFLEIVVFSIFKARGLL